MVSGIYLIDDSTGKGLSDVTLNCWRRVNLSWNTVEVKGTTMEQTWKAKTVVYKNEF
jgi:hypothetical protein